MHKTLKKYFIPHEENNYHPHILHTKRTVFYGLIFSFAKIIMVVFVMLLPTEVFVLPDVLAEEQRQIVTLTNEVRVERGLPALTVATKLETSSQNKATDMAEKEYFAHTQDNQTVSVWLKSAGYEYETAGENLAVGYSTAQDIVNAWENSPAHYANLIDTDFVDFGVGLAGGVYENRPTIFIAQHFASPRSLDENIKNPVYVETKPKIEEKIVQKPIEADETVREITEFSSTSTAVLSVKVGTVIPTADPVVDLKAPTPIEKYIQSKSVLSPITNIFEVSRNIYLVSICFFIFTLLLSVFFEIHKKHPHVVFKTSGLIVLLVLLWKF